MKERVRRISIFILSILVLFLGLYFSFNGLTGFTIYTYSSSGEFGGTFLGTSHNGSGIILYGSNSSGTYTSEVIDANQSMIWENLNFSKYSSNSHYLLAEDGSGAVYSSIDDGITWTEKNSNYGRGSSGELFSDSNYNYIVFDGSAKEVWRSGDLGITWSVVNNSFANNNIYIGESGNGEIYIADGSGDIYESQDQGINWELKGDFNAGASNTPKGMAINSTSGIFVVDGSGSVWVSTDSGVNWVEANSGYGGTSGTDDLEVDSNDYLYILINTEIYQSTDFGVTWNVINDSISPYANTLVEMLIDSNDDFYILDAVGRVFKSIDNGITWTEESDINGGASNTPQSIGDFNLFQNVTFQVRNCSLSNCGDGSFRGPDGTSGSYYYQNSTLNLYGRYFQYKFFLTGADSSNTPILRSVEVSNSDIDPDSPIISFGDGTYSQSSYNLAQNSAFFVNLSVTDSSRYYSFLNFNNSLFGFWKFNDTDSVLRDYSGKGLNGTVVGATSSQGYFGNSLYFDGNDYIDLGDIDLFEKNYSLSFWVKRYGNSNTDIISKYISPSDTGDWNLRYRDTDKIHFYYLDSSGTTQVFLSSKSLVDESWNHVVLMYSAGESNSAKFYINGVLDSGSTWDQGDGSGTYANSDSHMLLGAGRLGSLNNFLNGSLDEFIIFDRILSSSEVSSLYSSSEYNTNFTNLGEGNYSFVGYAQDEYGNEAQTNIRSVSFVVNSAPLLSILIPNGEAYGSNLSIPLNFSVVDSDDNLDSCWFNYDGNNITISNCLNTTFNVPSSGSYNLNLYANDTSGDISNESSTFSVSIGSPAIGSVQPINNLYVNYSYASFNYTATDLDLDTCSLWGDFNGTYSLNTTDYSLSSGVSDYFALNLSEGDYNWSISCNDSLGNVASISNRTLNIDLTNPNLQISEPSGSYGSLSGIPLVYSVNDSSPLSCNYNLSFASTGNIVVPNTQISNCGSLSFDVDTESNYLLWVSANDSAGNEISKNTTFSVSVSSTQTSSSSSSGGSSGGGSVTLQPYSLSIPALNSFNLSKGESEIVELNLKNEGSKFLNSCKIIPSEEIAEWISSSQNEDVGPGQSTTMIFSINIPVDASEGNYKSNLGIDCEEYIRDVALEINIISGDYNVVIKSSERDGTDLLVNYSLENKKNENKDFSIEYSLVDKNNVELVSGTEVVSVDANSNKDYVLRFELPKNSVGEFSLVMGVSDGVFVNKYLYTVLLQSGSGISGLAISENNSQTLIYLGILTLLGALAYGVFSFLKKNHRKVPETHKKVRNFITLDLKD